MGTRTLLEDTMEQFDDWVLLPAKGHIQGPCGLMSAELVLLAVHSFWALSPVQRAAGCFGSVWSTDEGLDACF